MSLESEGYQAERKDEPDPYIAAVERKIGNNELPDEAIPVVADMGRTLTLVCTFISSKQQDTQILNRAKGLVSVLTLLGQKKLIDVALSNAILPQQQRKPSK